MSRDGGSENLDKEDMGMTDEDRARVRDAQAKAWMEVSSMSSALPLDSSSDDLTQAMALVCLVDLIRRHKKKISDLIDSIPD